jgi:hypothetical protein
MGFILGEGVEHTKLEGFFSTDIHTTEVNIGELNVVAWSMSQLSASSTCFLMQRLMSKTVMTTSLHILSNSLY